MPVELHKGIYWVGSVDWNVRQFHGYQTHRGSTYNAYLVVGEKIALIDTVKRPFFPEMLRRIEEIVDPARIDYVVSNHVEMDHSGAIPPMMEKCPRAKLVTGAPNGLKGLKLHYGEGFDYLPVKTGESLDLGGFTLSFVQTPMVHWPDNMATYVPEAKILFSNDAFGQHYASSERFYDEADRCAVDEEAQKYYANIVLPYGAQVGRALAAVSGLELEIIAPSHGVMWRGAEDIAAIAARYEGWVSGKLERKAVVVYDTMWHSTERMAQAIAEGFIRQGVSTKLYCLQDTHHSDIVPEIMTAQYLAVGSPTLNNGMMPLVAGLLCYVKGLVPGKGHSALAFGSYGWGGQSAGLVQQQLDEAGFDRLLEMERINYIPTAEQLAALTERVAAAVQ